MAKKKRRQRQTATRASPPKVLGTFLAPAPYDTTCVGVDCTNKTIRGGEEVLESPTTPGFFYHLECFRRLIRGTGKDPDQFLQIINYPASKPN